MTLWHLEWLRLVRTRRLVALLGVNSLLGLTTPYLARYQNEVFEQVGGGVELTMPDATTADALDMFGSNAGQLGVLTVLIVAVLAFAADGGPRTIFLRTRVHRDRDLVLPALAVNGLAATAAWTCGLALAYYETAVLITPPAVGMTLLGWLFGTLYHWFLVALALLCTRLMSGTVGAIVVPVAVLLALGLAGTMERVRGWVPTALAGARGDLVRDGDPSRFVPGVLVTLAASVLAAYAGIRLTRRREL
jgi:ABC-2 type transport system permease protein